MLRPRIIPCLLLKGHGLVKTLRFREPRYIGDPVNSIRIFNDKEVDELIVLDITATIEGRKPDFGLISDLASETFMPIAYGGGITELSDVHKLISSGVEKVVINSKAVENSELIKIISSSIGSQSVVVSIDVNKNIFGKYKVFSHSGNKNTGLDPLEWSRVMETMGAGELFINSIDRDGTMSGYDIELIRGISNAVNIPVIAAGGAGSLNDLKVVLRDGGASAAAAGSMFVFNGRHKAVLITYPTNEEIDYVHGKAV